MPRPKGYSPGQTRRITHRIGEWSWDADSLLAKQERGHEHACWQWKGSRGEQGNLFGAFKNDRAQMTQANRLIYATMINDRIDNVSVRMRCMNKWCCNPNHFNIVKKYTRKGEPVFKLTLPEYAIGNIDAEQLNEVKKMAREFAHLTGIDWEYEYRWMTMTASDLLVAQLKYPELMKLFKVQQIVS